MNDLSSICDFVETNPLANGSTAETRGSVVFNLDGIPVTVSYASKWHAIVYVSLSSSW